MSTYLISRFLEIIAIQPLFSFRVRPIFFVWPLLHIPAIYFWDFTPFVFIGAGAVVSMILAICPTSPSPMRILFASKVWRRVAYIAQARRLLFSEIFLSLTLFYRALMTMTFYLFGADCACFVIPFKQFNCFASELDKRWLVGMRTILICWISISTSSDLVVF